MRRYLLGVILLVMAGGAHGQNARAVDPVGGQKVANALGASAVDAGDYLYVSGQGAKRPDGSVPSSFHEQATQVLENVKALTDAAGLSMDHVVYVQVYLEDVSKSEEFAAIFKKYFPARAPAGAILGVAKLPTPAIQMNAVAVRDLKDCQAVIPDNFKFEQPFSPGVLTHDRLFVSGMQGRDPASGKIPDDPGAQTDMALDGLKIVAEAAGITMKHFVFINPYLTEKIPARVMNERYARRFEFGNTPARATIGVSALSDQAQIEYTGVAVRDLTLRRAIRPKNMPPSPTASPCVFAGETLYCSAKSGFIPGPHGGVYAETTAAQLRQTMRNQLDNLEEAEMDYSTVVSTTVYLDHLTDSEIFEKVYREYFSGILPAQTLLQQLAPTARTGDAEGHFPDLEQMSLIAIKRPTKAN